MKKVIIGLSAILISAFIVILAVNAQNTQKETKKCSAEIPKDGSKCHAPSSCCMMKCGDASEATACDKAKCKEKGCDPANCKEGNFENKSCKSACITSSEGVKKCCEGAHKCNSSN